MEGGRGGGDALLMRRKLREGRDWAEGEGARPTPEERLEERTTGPRRVAESQPRSWPSSMQAERKVMSWRQRRRRRMAFTPDRLTTARRPSDSTTSEIHASHVTHPIPISPRSERGRGGETCWTACQWCGRRMWRRV